MSEQYDWSSGAARITEFPRYTVFSHASVPSGATMLTMASRSGQLSLSELEKRYASADAPVSPQALQKLRRDPRLGAQRLYRRLKKKADRERTERDRLEAMLHFERLLWRAGIERIAGVDEVGVGPMAGPVVAAAVVLRPGTWIDAVDDSKRLDPEQRAALDQQIRAAATGVGIGVVEPEEIDRLNIYNAGIHAMWLAVDSLSVPPRHVLVDSRTIPDLPQPQNSFYKGDGINFSIACASIVAKVYRDRLMEELDRKYPGYGFARHKGYCTSDHQRAVQRLGPSPIHRQSFDYIRELRGEYDPLFYDLKKQVAQAATRDELGRWEDRLKASRHRLSSNETRKLHILAGRRWKRVD